MPMDYKQYIEELTADITTTLTEASCQPILFIGSGFSKRYAQAPNWEELLRALTERCPLVDKEFAYFKQTYSGPIEIGGVLTKLYREWAWGAGRKKFPAEYFSEKYPQDIFIKHTVAEILGELGPNAKGSFGSPAIDVEIVALRKINPHAIITTNYDRLLEPMFPDYECVIGQNIWRKPYLSIGEIFKVHGCISEPPSIVLTPDDYAAFEQDKKYLSAKLLTYFAEHPLLFIGYRAEDPNIKSVLYDVDRMIRPHMELIPNIYILEWNPDITEKSYPARDRVLSVGPDKNIRIKSITASAFDWVFNAFGASGDLEKVNVKLLRALMARTVELIRTDFPKKHVEVDFQTLEHAVETGDTFAKLFGVTSISDPAQVNASYPYTLTSVAEQLGFGFWTGANQLLEKIKQTTGLDIKSSDNRFHITMRTGKAKGSITHKYSQATVDLLVRVQTGKSYDDLLKAGIKEPAAPADGKTQKSTAVGDGKSSVVSKVAVATKSPKGG